MTVKDRTPPTEAASIRSQVDRDQSREPQSEEGNFPAVHGLLGPPDKNGLGWGPPRPRPLLGPKR